MSDEIVLKDDDVVSMDDSDSFTQTSTSTSTELMEALEKILGKQGDRLNSTAASNWGSRGVYCKVLQVKGGGWQTGKVRLRLEFIPDELPKKSPLDDLRSDLDI